MDELEAEKILNWAFKADLWTRKNLSKSLYGVIIDLAFAFIFTSALINAVSYENQVSDLKQFCPIATYVVANEKIGIDFEKAECAYRSKECFINECILEYENCAKRPV